MRYLSESDVTQMMGIGYLGEVRQGPDGNLYQYVQGVDGLGNPIGFWRGWRKRLKKFVGRALPIAQKFAPFIPGASAALTVATPFLKQAGVAGYEGIGALYEAPDGSIYQVHGLAEDAELRGIDEDSMTQMMGIGYIGEMRQGPDGGLYQWVEGIDGLGNAFGFWKGLKRLARKALKYHPVAAALRAASPYLRKALPIAQQVASVIPGGEAALTAAAPILKEAGVAGYAGLGALYQAPDGTLYQQQVQGLDDDAELRGLDADDELRGIDDDQELRGFDEGEELRGIDDDMELRGLEDDMELRGLDDSEDLRGFEADQEMQGIDGYVRQDGMSGLEAYVPQEPPQTRWHARPALAPEVWKPLW
ncbi:MAG: hypothetical protein ACT4P5_00425 [Armatimonadota bacterium]